MIKMNMGVEKKEVKVCHLPRTRRFIVMTLAIWTWCAGVLVAGIGMGNTPGWAGEPFRSAVERHEKKVGWQRGFADVAQAVTPAVVNITATIDRVEFEKDGVPPPFGGFGERRPPSDIPKRQRGAGSGIIISSDGYIVTSNHVVAQSRDLVVILPDGREFSAKVVGTDPGTDLAVMKIQANGLPVIPWGNSSSLAVGQYVLAIGNPFGLNSTVTLGIVSALDRGGMGLARFEDFIQTDAAINPGNSGGALVNIHGELVGINTAIASQSGGYQGVGFAVPSSSAKPVLDELIRNGKIVRGYVGMGVQEITKQLAPWFGLKKSEGALVTDVVPGGPADKAGIHRGEVILQYQGKDVKDGQMLLELVTRAKIGQLIELGILENGIGRKVPVVIQEQPSIPQLVRARPTQIEHPLAGVEAAEVDEASVQEYGLNPDTRGAVVSFLEEGCAAELAGIMEGDVIVEINKHPVLSVSEYSSWYQRLKGEGAILVVVVRASRHLYVLVKSS